MSNNLLFYAGREAYSQIMDDGLRPESIAVVSGAAGGPKWLVLDGLDRALFFNWLKSPYSNNNAIHLVGASIGAWRFTAICQDDGNGRDEEAYDRFSDAYIHQSYVSYQPPGPTARDVTNEGLKIMNAYLDDDGIEIILKNKNKRLNIITALSRGLLESDNKYLLTLYMTICGAANYFSRRSLGAFFKRSLFYDPREMPPVFNSFDTTPTEKVRLTSENIRKAILASGSIPIVMSGVGDIPDAPPGVFRDGGLLDYHMNIPYGPFAKTERKIVLFPHYVNRIIPGWFDKIHPLRKPNRENLKNVLMLSPSPEFVEKLPYGKIPDRRDFKRFKGDDAGRIKYWKRVVKESQALGEEFLEVIDRGKIVEVLTPL